LHFYVFIYFFVKFYFSTFTPKCFVLAVVAISAKLRAMLWNKICKKNYIISALLHYLYARRPILRKILRT